MKSTLLLRMAAIDRDFPDSSSHTSIITEVKEICDVIFRPQNSPSFWEFCNHNKLLHLDLSCSFDKVILIL